MKFPKHIPTLRRLSIKCKLVMTYLLTSIVPLAFLCIYSFNLYSESMIDKISASTSQTLSLINTNMVTELEKYQYLCGSICTNEKIQDALSMDNITSGEKNRIMLDIQDIVKTQIIYPAQAKNITIYDTNNRSFYNLGYDGFYDDDVKKILSDIEDKAPDDSWNYVLTYRSRDIIVLARRILDRNNTNHVLGYTLISIDEKLFSETVLEPANLPEDSNIFYMTVDGTVLSSWDRSIVLGQPFENEELLRKIKTLLPKKTESFELELQGEKYLATYTYNKSINHFFISTIPFSYIDSATHDILEKMGLIALLLFLVCFVTISFIYYSIQKPISRMVSFCQDISLGNFGSQLLDEGNDELSYLSNSMDNMANQIQNLLQTQRENEKRKHELELQMLQYQINPHFLFNTLNSLRLVAYMNQDLVVSEGIQALSSLLQNTLTNKHEYITIKEELTNLKNYFSIQKIRYAGNFEVSYVVDEDLLDCIIPKLILQPLAENSIMHGSSEDGSTMRITICGSIIDGKTILTLSDDGKGFDSNREEPPAPQGKGIGIKNVNDRIQLSFGKEYSLTISSVPGQGTICNLTLPQIRLH